MTSDIIFIEGLRIHTVIGVFDWEKEFKQPLIFDLELATDLRASAASDDINDTVSYKTISDELIALVEASRYDLLETLAETVCQHIFDHHRAVEAITLTLKKPHAVIEASNVGLKIQRQRN